MRRPLGGSRSGGVPTLDRLDRIEAAVVKALVYADLFDWPLSPAEIHRYLPVSARLDEVHAALSSLQMKEWVDTIDGLFLLRGRETLVEARHQRAAISARLWPQAVRYARLVSRLPWVRLVAVSGSLAVDAAVDDADVDFFIVTENGRLWLTRALTIATGRFASAATSTPKTRLCPNYLVTVSALHLPQRDLFTAHELAQMVPLFGPDAYYALLERNNWYRQLLPNHPGYRGTITDLGDRGSHRIIERVLSDRLVGRIERYEMQRKTTRLRLGALTPEAQFDASICKGHFGQHRARTLEAFQARLRGLEEPPR